MNLLVHRIPSPSRVRSGIRPALVAVALTASVGLVASCGSSTDTTTGAPPGSTRGSTVVGTGVPDTGGPGSTRPVDQDPGPVYLAVLRNGLGRSVTTGTSRTTARATTPYARIVLVDRAVPGAEEPTGFGGAGGTPFSAGTRRTIEQGLADLGPVQWVSSGEGVSVQSGPGAEEVKVVLGPLQANGDGFAVGMSKTCGPMCGNGGTVLVENRQGEWVVTGATGGGWIS